ncbi:MAG: hypothetical protein JHC95_09635, partial [Solirubrobacteraceae bacterium]|nr:hypothetical protein [Solirubrobacteraceae bacterium]
MVLPFRSLWLTAAFTVIVLAFAASVAPAATLPIQSKIANTLIREPVSGNVGDSPVWGADGVG